MYRCIGAIICILSIINYTTYAATFECTRCQLIRLVTIHPKLSLSTLTVISEVVLVLMLQL